MFDDTMHETLSNPSVPIDMLPNYVDDKPVIRGSLLASRRISAGERPSGESGLYPYRASPQRKELPVPDGIVSQK